jgi:hypothetical protein
MPALGQLDWNQAVDGTCEKQAQDANTCIVIAHDL